MITIRRIGILATACLLVAALLSNADAPATAQTAEPAEAPDRCSNAAREASPAGVITGFFTYYESDPCVAEAKMADVKQTGGDTLITFGFRLEQRQVDGRGQVLTPGGQPDPKYSCWEGRATCHEAAAAGLDDSSIRRVLTFSGTERLGSEMVRCPRRDRNVLSQGIRFQRILLPVGNDQSCEVSHAEYDLVLINNGTPESSNPVATMLETAHAADIEMFLGLPKPSMNPQQPWLADITYLDSLERFTHRLLSDWRSRYAALDSFAGLYQSIEMPMKGNPAWDDQYALYGAQHGVAHNVLPQLPIMLSPYIDARPRMTSPVEGVPLAIQRMVATSAGSKVIIAPQDGRGTGKGGMFFPNEVDEFVDERLEPVVGGHLSYGDAYFAAARAYYEAAASAGRKAGGDRFALWANIELMEPSPLSGEPACSTGTNRGRATADRVMKQVAVAGNTVTKLIGFDWDQMMQCAVPGKETLTQHLLRVGDHPAPTGLAPVTRTGVNGVLVTGYNLADGDVIVTYRSAAGERQSASFPASEHHFDENFGEQHPDDYPPGIQAIFLPWRPSSVDTHAPWLSVDITTPRGTILYGAFTDVW